MKENEMFVAVFVLFYFTHCVKSAGKHQPALFYTCGWLSAESSKTRPLFGKFFRVSDALPVTYDRDETTQWRGGGLISSTTCMHCHLWGLYNTDEKLLCTFCDYIHFSRRLFIDVKMCRIKRHFSQIFWAQRHQTLIQ